MNCFDQQLAIGRFWERSANRALQSKGYATLPLYLLSDGDAPALEYLDSRLIVPDILALRAGRWCWWEVKFKTASTVYRKTGTNETGIPIRHRNDYAEVKRRSGYPVYIMFIHERDNFVGYGELDALKVSHVYEGDRMSRGGEVFYRVDSLTRIMTADALRQFAPAGRENRPAVNTHAIREGIRV
jgi:hypothetical protein